MKKASNILYTIGKVFNIIEIVGLAFLFILGIAMVAFAPELVNEVEEEISVEEGILAVSSSGYFLIFFAIIAIVAAILALVFCAKSKKAIDEGEKSLKPYILTIVFGAISDSIFYVLSGVFALINRNNSKNA